MTPVLIPCSRSAHDQNVLARRPQGDNKGAIPKRARHARVERLLIKQCLFRRAQFWIHPDRPFCVSFGCSGEERKQASLEGPFIVVV